MTSWRMFVDPCETTFCAFGAKCLVEPVSNTAYCKCIERCQPTFAPVCGTDDVSYANECALRKASCQLRKRIAVARPGSCGTRVVH